MKIPLDQICVRSGVLCPRCRELVASGRVNEFEVELMRILLELENDPQFKFLKESSYVKSYLKNSILVMILDLPENVTSQQIARLARTISSRVSENLGNVKIRVVRRSNDVRNMIAQILAPARIQGVNTLWSPDGTVQHIVRVPRNDVRFLPGPVNELEELFKEIFNEQYRIRIV